MTSSQPVSVCLFAHQDDEFGIYKCVADDLKKGRRVLCAYLTDGASRGVSAQRRNQESVAVLVRMGVPESDIIFAGQALSIGDGQLIENLAVASDWLRSQLSRLKPVESLYIPCWEGGHHDHDALHAIAVGIAMENDMLPRVRQFPLYNGYGVVGPLFRVLLPLAPNGPVEEIHIAWKHRLAYLRHCLRYRSQTATWVGLFPFVVLDYMFHGVQKLQPVSFERTQSRPHAGPLYYERRGFCTWDIMHAKLAAWRGSSIAGNLGIKSNEQM